jgi:hypothetical protein
MLASGFWKYDLFSDTDGIIAVPSKLLGFNAFEVADTRQATFTSFSKKSYMRWPRKVTTNPTTWFSRILNPAMDFLAKVFTGAWPVMRFKSSDNRIEHLGIFEGLANTSIDDNFLDMRHSHDIIKTKLFLSLVQSFLCKRFEDYS